MTSYESRVMKRFWIQTMAVILASFAFWILVVAPRRSVHAAMQAGNGQAVGGQQYIMVMGSDGTLARTLSTDTSGRLNVNNSNVAGSTDPCMSSSVLKSSSVINVTSATTTALVAVSGTKSVYVCGLSITIAPSATSADTATIEYGSGTACATSPTALTGAFGAGDLTTAAPPLFVTLADPGTSMTAPSGNGICLLSAGTTVNIQGIVQWVQQ